MNIKMLLSGIALAIASQTAMAGDFKDVYAGIAGGTSKLKGPNAAEFDLNTSAFKVFAGYNVHQYIDIEGSYTNTGKSKVIVPGYTGQAQNKNLFGVDAIFKYSLNEVLPFKGITPFAKVGLGYSNFDYKIEDENGYGKINEKSIGLNRMGLGVKYDLMNNLAIRAEYEVLGRKKIDGDTVQNNVTTIGIQYNY